MKRANKGMAIFMLAILISLMPCTGTAIALEIPADEKNTVENDKNAHPVIESYCIVDPEMLLPGNPGIDPGMLITDYPVVDPEMLITVSPEQEQQNVAISIPDEVLEGLR